MQMGKLAGSVAILGVACLLALRCAAEEPASKPIQIGLADSVFRDTPASLIGVLSRPLKALMESQSGVSGEIMLAGDAIALADKLKANKLQLAVFHGFEFAWARQHCPELKPLVVAIANHRMLHAHLVVLKDGGINSCGDLKGKVIGLPAVSREHLHLYLERRCPAMGSDPHTYFSQVIRPNDPEEALDDVINGRSQAAIVDRVALDNYQESKPALAAKLRVLQQSEPFPPSVIAYIPGGVDESILKRFREGMLNASQTPQSRSLLKLCRITSFEDAPADFERWLADIAKAYPRVVPAEKKAQK
jgi:ABC-type phosphate/phosphonate transport system substrate-binding protein